MIKDSASGGSNAARINEERLIHALSCMLGENITVSLDSGSTLQGVFQGFDPLSRGAGRIADIAVSDARFVTAEDDKSQGRPMIVAGSDYHYFTAMVSPKYHSYFIGGSKPQQRKFKTDAEISESKPRFSHAHQHEHGDLTEWHPDTPLAEDDYVDLDEEAAAAASGKRNEAHTSGRDATSGSASGSASGPRSSSGTGTSWNQFEANSKAFGITSTYDENVYTTPLDLSTIPPQVQDRAGYLAREISSGDGSGAFGHLDNLLEEDEDEDGIKMDNLQHVQKTISKFTRELKKREKPLVPVRRSAISTDSQQTTQASIISSSAPSQLQAGATTASSEMQDANSKRAEKYSHEIPLNTLNLEPGSAASVTLPPQRRERSIIPERKQEPRHVFESSHASGGATVAEAASANPVGTSTNTSGTISSAASKTQTFMSSSQRQNALLKSQDQASVGGDAYKKSFKFNPNATTFTPGSSDTGVHAPIVVAAAGGGSSSHTRSTRNVSPHKTQHDTLQPPPPPPTPLLLLQKVAEAATISTSSGSGSNARTNSTTAATAADATSSSGTKQAQRAVAVPLKSSGKMGHFEPFKSYSQYPKLDLGEFRRYRRPFPQEDASELEEQYNHKWPSTTGVSYRMVFEQALANKGLVLVLGGASGAFEKHGLVAAAGPSANEKQSAVATGGAGNNALLSSSHHQQAPFATSNIQVANAGVGTGAGAGASTMVASNVLPQGASGGGGGGGNTNPNDNYTGGLSMQQTPQGMVTYTLKQTPSGGSSASANGRQHHVHAPHQQMQQVLIQRPRGSVPPPGYFMPPKK